MVAENVFFRHPCILGIFKHYMYFVMLLCTVISCEQQLRRHSLFIQLYSHVQSVLEHGTWRFLVLNAAAQHHNAVGTEAFQAV